MIVSLNSFDCLIAVSYHLQLFLNSNDDLIMVYVALSGCIWNQELSIHVRDDLMIIDFLSSCNSAVPLA